LLFPLTLSLLMLPSLLKPLLLLLLMLTPPSSVKLMLLLLLKSRPLLPRSPRSMPRRLLLRLTLPSLLKLHLPLLLLLKSRLPSNTGISGIKKSGAFAPLFYCPSGW
jgi:hypothetical protein